MKKQGDTPIANVIITLTFVHSIQLFTLYLILLHFFPKIDILDNTKSFGLGVFFIAFCVVNYFLMYNKNRWDSYMEEFKGESPKESRQGKLLVLAYLVGSIVIFFIMMPVLYGV